MIVLVLSGLVVAALVTWALSQPPGTWVYIRELVERAVSEIRQLGAGWFFSAYAVLPAFGFPVSVFALSAGPVFGPVLGLPLVLSLAGLCMAVNMSVSYVLARRFLRPWITRLLKYLGYSIPVVAVDKQRMFSLLVRITPGPPYVLQSFLLGLIEVPYRTYMLISWPIATAMAALVILFGDAVAQGRGRVALLALLGVGVFAILIRWMRKRFSTRSSGAGPITGDDV
ncbi:MAG: hypothetical protein NTU80_03655 [Verrucomicrobia bacterium]|nr:hypothetical protein [Verrucomicrobiota bacterium]